MPMKEEKLWQIIIASGVENISALFKICRLQNASKILKAIITSCMRAVKNQNISANVAGRLFLL